MIRPLARVAAVLLAATVLAGGAAASWAYFTETKTSPQPITVATFPVAVKYESTSTPAGSVGQSVTVSRPSGVVAGWLLVATIGGEGSLTVTPPSGWTAAGAPFQHPGGQISVRSFWHYATASEPASYVFDLNSLKRASGGIVAYSGVTAANPIATTASASGRSVTATAPSATAVYATRWLSTVTFGGLDPLTFSAPLTERWERGTLLENVGVAEAALPAGPTPAATVRGFPGLLPSDWVMQTIVLNAAA